MKINSTSKKIFIIVLMAFSTFQCYCQILLPNGNAISSAQKISPDSIITIKSLQETVAFLASDNLKGRLTGSSGADIAANYIAREFRSSGLNMVSGFEGYFNSFKYQYEGKEVVVRNVLAVLPPLSFNDTTVIISAHYDHVGQGNDISYNKGYNRRDKIFNGANDNASGVAVMLSLAKYYAAARTNKYTLLFVAYSGEELGLIGSTKLSEELENNIIKGVINMDMMGRPLNNHCYIIGNNESAVAKKLNAVLSANAGYPTAFFQKDEFPDEWLILRSDHYPFLNSTHFCFTLMASSPTDKYYHTVDDEYDTIDFNGMHKAAINIATALSIYLNVH